MKKHFWMIGILILSAAVITGCGLQVQAAGQGANQVDPPIVTEANVILAEGRLTPRYNAWLSFELEGKVEELLVKEGQVVKAGDVLARLGNREQLDAQVKAAELERLSAQQALDDLNNLASVAGGQAWQALTNAQKALIEAQERFDELDTDAYEDEIEDAWVKVQDLKTELEDAQEEFDKYADLNSDNANRRRAEDALKDAQKRYDEAVREHDRLTTDLEQARADLAQAEAAVSDAQRKYNARKDGPDPDDLALAKARLENAEAQLAAAQAALENLELVAPFDGTVVEIEFSQGERVLPNQAALLLADFSIWKIETSDLNELDVVRINPDKPVKIIPDALPDLVLTGHVERISDHYEEKSGDILYTVHIWLDDSDPRLRWGMTVSTEFERK